MLQKRKAIPSILFPTMKIQTHDMHTGGEPLRIIQSGYPDLMGSTVLEKREYAKSNLDRYRKFLMNEPRGHKDMYGAVLVKKNNVDNEFEVLFFNNEGYSPMCGHAVIALGRYVIDYNFVKPASPETEVTFHCPCGPVRAYAEFSDGSSGRVRFESVPAFVYKLGVTLKVPHVGEVVFDIAFGGAFYVIVKDEALSIQLKSTPLSDIIRIAGEITDAVKEKIPIIHPESEELSSLYGTIITDGKDQYSDGPTTNICVFADKQVDRSPTGSGVTARIALQFLKGFISLNQEKEFKSILGTSFKGKAVREAKQGSFSAVVVEVSGIAHHTGDHTFYLEDSDPFSEGFQLSRSE